MDVRNIPKNTSSVEGEILSYSVILILSLSQYPYSKQYNVNNRRLTKNLLRINLNVVKKKKNKSKKKKKHFG